MHVVSQYILRLDMFANIRILKKTWRNKLKDTDGNLPRTIPKTTGNLKEPADNLLKKLVIEGTS